MSAFVVGTQPGAIDGDDMAVIFSSVSLFGEPVYEACVQRTEMIPARVSRIVGTFKTRNEAEAAALSALNKAAP